MKGIVDAFIFYSTSVTPFAKKMEASIGNHDTALLIGIKLQSLEKINYIQWFIQQLFGKIFCYGHTMVFETNFMV